MKTTLRSLCVGCSLALALAVGTFVTAQEKKADTAKTADKKVETKAAEPAKKAAGRLPANFAKLDLSDDQKAKIYSVQATYNAQIEELKAKLKSLQEKEDAEIEAVLKPEQLKALTDIRAAAKKKADEKKAADKAKTVAPKTEASAEPAKKAEEPAKKVEATKK